MAFVLCTACDNLEAVNDRIDLKLDPEIPESTKEQIKSDFRELAKYDIEVSSDSIFAQIFGTEADAALRFLDDRVKYVIPENADLMDRLRISLLNFKLPDDIKQEANQNNCNGGAKSESGVKAYVAASNVGAGLWMAQAMNPFPWLLNIKFQVGDRNVPIDSPRVGILMVGKGYDLMTMDKKGNPIGPSVRASIWIHEARHSDCPNGLDVSDMARLQAGLLPKDPSCGQTHALCPPGHDLAGLPACDAHPWGAYAVGAVFSQAIGKNCKNCTEEDRQQSLIAAADSFSRVIPLEEMLEGKLGKPSLTASTRVSYQGEGIYGMDKSKMAKELAEKLKVRLLRSGSEDPEINADRLEQERFEKAKKMLCGEGDSK